MNIRHPKRYEKWLGIISDWKSTGLSIAAYCREHEIPQWKFFDWKRRLAERESEDETAAGFVAVEFSSEGSGCGIGVRVGFVELQLSRGFDERELLRTIQVLRRLPC